MTADQYVLLMNAAWATCGILLALITLTAGVVCLVAGIREMRE